MRSETDDLDGAGLISLYMQTKEAFDAGAHPEAEVDNFAYVWQDTAYIQEGSTTSGGNKYLNRPVDAKARRSFKGEQQLICSQENISIDNVTLTMGFGLRVLLWMP